MNIAICDDDLKLTGRLKTDIQIFFKNIKDNGDVSVFMNGTDLIKK